MKLVKVQIELIVDYGVCEQMDDISTKDCIVDYLNDKLHNDPEFFGDFGPENIVFISEIGR